MATTDYREGTGFAGVSRREFLRISAGGALGVSALSILGCSPTASPGGARKPSVEIEISTTATAAGLLSTIIEQEKYDEKNGLRLAAKVFSPAEAERAVVLKKVPAGLMVPISAARSTIEGTPIKLIFGQLAAHQSVVVPKDSPARELKDLKGKKIGVTAKVTAAYGAMLVLSKMQGLDFEKDFQLSVGETPVYIASLERGDLDAIVVFEPFTSKLVAPGKYRILFDQNEMWRKAKGGPLLSAGVGAHKEWVDSNRETVKALQQAYLAAVKYVQSKPPRLRQIYKELFKIEDEPTLKLIEERMPAFYNLTWSKEDIENGKAYIKESVRLGVLAEEPKEDIFVPML